jgi:hypothetical protein
MALARGSGSCLALPHSLGRCAWGRTTARGTVLSAKAVWHLKEQSRRQAASRSTQQREVESKNGFGLNDERIGAS